MTPTEQARAFQHQPGQPGVLARLFLAWNPEAVQLWLNAWADARSQENTNGADAPVEASWVLARS